MGGANTQTVDAEEVAALRRDVDDLRRIVEALTGLTDALRDDLTRMRKVADAVIMVAQRQVTEDGAKSAQRRAVVSAICDSHKAIGMTLSVGIGALRDVVLAMLRWPGIAVPVLWSIVGLAVAIPVGYTFRATLNEITLSHADAIVRTAVNEMLSDDGEPQPANPASDPVDSPREPVDLGTSPQ